MTLKSLFSNVLLLALVLGLSGSVMSCNTLHGAGEDIEGAGETVQDAAD